jgi:hypothetical protein
MSVAATESVGSRMRTIGLRRRALKAGDRVLLHYDDGTEEPRTVLLGPRQIKVHSGRKWAIWLVGTTAWFALWRVRPIDEVEAH